MDIKVRNVFLPVLLGCFVLLFSCKGQDKSVVREQLQDSSDTLVKKEPLGNYHLNSNLKDSLFYIEGQLCQHLRKIFQDSKGNLWFGTNVYGIMRYDGKELKYFTKHNGFNGGRVTGIIEDKLGNVWIGAYGGVIKYDGSSFINYGKEHGLLNDEVWSLALDSNGLFWVGTHDGLYQFDGKVFTPFNLPKPEAITPNPMLSENRINTLYIDDKGTLWIGRDGLGICKYDGQSFTHITTQDGLPDNVVSGILEDTKGNVWITTMFGGICLFDGKTFTNFTKNGTVKGVETGALYEDAKDNIWFSSEGYGAYVYDGKIFKNYYKSDGLNTGGVLAIYEDKEQRFWFGGWGGLFRYDPSAMQINGETFFSVTKEGPWK